MVISSQHDNHPHHGACILHSSRFVCSIVLLHLNHLCRQFCIHGHATIVACVCCSLQESAWLICFCRCMNLWCYKSIECSYLVGCSFMLLVPWDRKLMNYWRFLVEQKLWRDLRIYHKWAVYKWEILLKIYLNFYADTFFVMNPALHGTCIGC